MFYVCSCVRFYVMIMYVIVEIVIKFLFFIDVRFIFFFFLVCKMYDVFGECCVEVRCKIFESLFIFLVIGGFIVRFYFDLFCYDIIDNCKNY